MKPKLSRIVDWSIKVMLGVVLVLAIQFAVDIYQRIDALMVAWHNPEVVAELEIETTMEVVSKD